MIRRRLLSRGMEADQMAKEWELIADITAEEEQANLEVVFDKEYNELDILILSVGSKNNTAENKNAKYNFNDGNSYYIGDIAFSSGVTRVVRMECKRYPYRHAEYSIFNQASLNSSATNKTGRGAFTAIDSNAAFAAFTVSMQASVFGVNSRVIIYGR